MKQLERISTITYRWWRSDSTSDIDQKHIEALEEAAEARIREMTGEGYRAGELSDNVRMTDDDPEDGVEYSGWWEISTA
jgi:hypothetical protein